MPSLRIVSPCTASWQTMRLVDGGRHCASCDRDVHDFTRSTETEAIARALLFGGSRLCGRLLVDGQGQPRFRPPVPPRQPRSRALPVVVAAAALGTGCVGHEPVRPAPSPAVQPAASADAPAACEPAAKVADAALPASDEAAGRTEIPRRVIVTTMGDADVVRHVTFRPGESELDENDAVILEEVAKLINGNPNIRKVVVKGHTDGLEPRADKLSRARADMVISFLVSRGVLAARLEPRALGATQPMDDATTPEGRARNRRVEFQIANDP